METNIEKIFVYCVLICINLLVVQSKEDEDSYGEIMDKVEEGTKAYEFHLDTGPKRDDRPDSELTYLELLDRNISRILMDPQKGQGPYLMKLIKQFAEDALRLRDMLLNKTEKVDKSLIESAIKVYQRYGHPRFMTVMVTNGGEYLQNTLDLSDDLMWEFYGYRQKANEFWDDIRAVIVQDHRSDKIEAERFRHLPWPIHLDNLTDFEKAVLERSDLNSDFDLANVLNIKSTMF
uniref:Uncharacterized protein n=1 Tax=Graphocephala atropunctata TaxID=36148 RepID=A0A1B6M440_9HEMI